jgi:hypothetical protein
VEHVTVGGRTSSYVPALQKLKKGVKVEEKPKKVKKEAPEEINQVSDEVDSEPAPKKQKAHVATSAASRRTSKRK